MAETPNNAGPLDVSNRRGSFSRAVEVTANLATIAVAILFCIVLVRVFLVPRARPTAARPDFHPAAKGTNLKSVLPGVDWAKNQRTLILAISTQCHFCTDSLPFFQKVTKDSGCHVKTLALLPQDKAQAEEYLSKGGVKVDDVRQVKLDSIGVNGTPTLLLVNAGGTVIDEWQGKLALDQQEQVLLELKKSTT